LRLIPIPPGKIEGGNIYYHSDHGKEDLTRASMNRIREIRGMDIGMVFQEPMTSLNPVFTVGNQIMETIQLHLKKTAKEARELAADILDKVGIPDPNRRLDEYPHQMSGGMKQRVMIAMSLVCNPKLLIADEPTTALDVTIQAQILDLMRQIQNEFNMSILLITHALAVVAEVADRVVVMYAGRIQESADVHEMFNNPVHPYTVGLFHSIPKVEDTRKRLTPIPGVVPNPLNFPVGCKFHNRCSHAMEICHQKEPELFEVAINHYSRCWLHKEPQ